MTLEQRILTNHSYNGILSQGENSMNKVMTTEQQIGMLEDLKAWMEKWNIVINDPAYNRDDGKYPVEIPQTPLHAENLGTLINLLKNSDVRRK